MVPALLLAATLVKYQEWGSSPEAYFMTRGERAQWAEVKTDAEAEAFINRFVASRGAGFADEVATRAQLADQYLSLGKTRGSKTIRGKIIIVLGPPKAMSIADRQVKGERSATTSGYMNAASDAGPSMKDVSDAARREGMSGKMLRDYTFTYPELVVTIEADPVSGTDRVPDKKQEAALERLFETAASAPLVITRPKQ